MRSANDFAAANRDRDDRNRDSNVRSIFAARACCVSATWYQFVPRSPAANPSISASARLWTASLAVGAGIATDSAASLRRVIIFFLEASLRRRLFLIALLSLALWLPTTTCPTPQARGEGSSNDRPTGWRRTELGWEEASRWQIDVPPVQLPTPATAVHPLVIASLELMISVGALAAVSPSSRKRRR